MSIALWVPRRQWPASRGLPRQLVVSVWPAVLWMEMRLGALRVPCREWPASRAAVLWMEMRLGALRVPRRQWPASRGLPRRLGVLKALWMLRRQWRASLMVPVWPAVLWMEDAATT